MGPRPEIADALIMLIGSYGVMMLTYIVQANVAKKAIAREHSGRYTTLGTGKHHR